MVQCGLHASMKSMVEGHCRTKILEQNFMTDDHDGYICIKG